MFQSPSLKSRTALRFLKRCKVSSKRGVEVRAIDGVLIGGRRGKSLPPTTLALFRKGSQKSRCELLRPAIARGCITLLDTTRSRVFMLSEPSTSMAISGVALRCKCSTYSGRSNVQHEQGDQYKAQRLQSSRRARGCRCDASWHGKARPRPARWPGPWRSPKWERQQKDGSCQLLLRARRFPRRRRTARDAAWRAGKIKMPSTIKNSSIAKRKNRQISPCNRPVSK